MLIQKNSKAVVFSAVLAASLGFGSAHAWALEGVISKDVVAAEELRGEGDYCHLKFPAIEPGTLASDHPVLQSADSGEIIDFYGPCNHDPLGQDEVKNQAADEAFVLDRDGD
jgi:hypothetical protein